jgi:hypothetical protein
MHSLELTIALSAASSSSEVNLGTALALGVPAAVAVVGLFITYANNLRLARRKDRLDWVNRQLSEMYGPLLSLSTASEAAWVEFRRTWRPYVGPYWGEPDPTEEECAAWRTWMSAVFMPLNRRMRDVVVERSDLVDEPSMPECLIDLCGYVAAYEAVIAQWLDGNLSQHAIDLNFPSEAVVNYAQAAFTRLKAEQRQLLAGSRSRGPAN